jgi:hypothetical protein
MKIFLIIFTIPLFGFGNSELIYLKDWDDAYSAEVNIQRPISDVWQYMSDSNKATEWSIYFHHITPTPGNYVDGSVDSIRRCYRKQDQTGVYWDEKVLFIEFEKKRIIYSYNFNGYKSDSDTYSTYVLQEYISVSKNSTRLIFKTKYSEKMTVWDRIMFFFAKKQVEEIFNKNLVNIKNRIEGHPSTYKYTDTSYNFFEK